MTDKATLNTVASSNGWRTVDSLYGNVSYTRGGDKIWVTYLTDGGVLRAYRSVEDRTDALVSEEHPGKLKTITGWLTSPMKHP
jgi:hypothetical protein